MDSPLVSSVIDMVYGKILPLVGAFALLLWSYDSFKSVVGICWGLLKEWFGVEVDYVQRYGKWAVITGGSDGIGRRYAMFLAGKGLNIAIIAMPDKKLNQTAGEIESKYGVEVMQIPVDFSKGFKLSGLLSKELADLEVGVLVNNVGTATSTRGAYFTSQSLDEHERILNVNIRAAVMMSHIVLPQMKERRRGLVINIASAFGLTPVPMVLMYGATKAFMLSFGEALREELRPFGVECQTVTPYFVRTTLTETFASTPLGRVVCADLNDYGKFLTMTVGKTSLTTGYWAHGILVTLLKQTPREIICRLYHKVGDFNKNTNKLVMPGELVK